MISKQTILQELELRTVADQDRYETQATIQWYATGNYKFKIYWPRQDRGELTAIGTVSLKTTNIIVDDKGIPFCQKEADESFYWDLESKELYKVVEGIQMPEEMFYPDVVNDDMADFDKLRSFELPDSFGMYLNLDGGTLSFFTDDQDLGMAFDEMQYRVWHLSFSSKGGNFDRLRVWECLQY